LKQALQPLKLDEVLAAGNAGTQILDVRDSPKYAKAHLSGSINIGLDGQYATWAGTMLDPDRPMVIVADPGREEEAALRLGRIGFDNVKGYLQDGMAALAERPDLIQTTERISPPMLADELTSSNPPLIIDVRTPAEWAIGHIEGSINLPLTQLQQRIDEVPHNRRIAVHCAGGYRSSIAASVLRQHGITNLIELAGGIAAWEAAKLKTSTG
jgi:rhodanese-related sulfurtransferase